MTIKRRLADAGRIGIVAMLVFVLCAPFSGSAATTVQPNTTTSTLDNGLLTHWTFDGAKTNWETGITEDTSGNNRNGTLGAMSTTTSPVTGKINQAFYFNGSTNYVDSSNFADNLSQFSISAWFSTTDPGGHSMAATPPLVSKIDSGGISTGVGWSVYSNYYDGTPRIFFFLQTDASNWASRYTTNAYSTDGTWHHVVCTYDSGTWHIYLDGVDQVLSSDNGGTLTSFSTPVNVRVGGGALSTERYLGSIDDVRIYNRVLSASEVSELFALNQSRLPGRYVTAGNSPTQLLTSGLTSYWTFNGPTVSGTSVTDLSGNSHTGTMVNGPTPAAGRMGQAFTYNGTNQYTDVSNSLPGTNILSISAWFKTTDNGVIFSEQNGAIGGSPSSWDPILYVDTNGYLRGGVYNGSVTSSLISSGTVNDGNWHHAVIMINGPTAAQTLYLDGAFVGSQTSGTPEGPFTYNYIGVGQSNFWPNTNNSWFYFKGDIDDVRVYSRILSSTEITHLTGAGRAVIHQ